jgi:hypothetical protein
VSELPESLRRDVVAEVYRQADELDWDALADRLHTAIYDGWLDEPAIGGQLTRFLTRERARVWLKDVPMKEYARARNNIGPFADLVASRFPSPGQIARQVLGPDWDMIDGTVDDKPNRCLIANGTTRRLMIWGPPKALRDVVWAGINAVVDQQPSPILIIAVPYGHPLDEGDKRRHVRLGRTAGLEVRHAVLHATKVTPGRHDGPDRASG